MSTNALNQVYKTAILAVEEAALTSLATAGDTTVQVSLKTMTQTPFIAGDGRPYTIMDTSWGAGANGLPNAERFVITSIDGTTVTPIADGVGYTWVGVLHISADTTAGWTGGLAHTYALANSPTVLCPGVEMAIQSADFNCRFKTLTDSPKIDFDDEASRFATGDEGRDFSIAGARSAEITFTEKLAWGGAANTMPVWAKIMRTMGHLPKKYTTTGIEFLPHTWANEITATIWVISPENGAAPSTTVYRYCGAHGGNGSSIGAGKIGDPYMLTGKYNAAFIGTTELTVAQTRALTSPETSMPEVLLSNLVTVPARVNGSTTSKEIEISQFTLDFGAVVNPFIDQASTTGYAYYVTSDRDPRFNCNPYYVRKSLDDVDYVVSNQVSGTVTVKSALTSPHITIEVPNAQLLSPALAAREGYINTNRVYRPLRNNLGTTTDSAIPDQTLYSILIGARA